MSAPGDVPLDAIDGTKLSVFLVAGFVAMIVPLGVLMAVADELSPPLDGLAPFLGLGAGILANGLLLAVGRKSVLVRRFVLRFAGGRVDLLSAGGQPLGSSADGTLALAAVNYVRRSKQARAVRAGVRLRAGSHDVLVAGLHGDPAWPGAETDPRTPAFEIDVAAFEALKRAVA
jgi:hypothetical protein